MAFAGRDGWRAEGLPLAGTQAASGEALEARTSLSVICTGVVGWGAEWFHGKCDCI